MRIFRYADAKKVQGRGYSKKVLVPEEELGIRGSFIQEVSFKKGDTVQLHHHKVQTEVFIALSEGTFMINGELIKLGPGDALLCEPMDVHGNPVIEKDFKILVLKINHVEDDIEWD
ncbi:MAG: cupin domain-containing protein [Methanomassiliicoccales archaeon]|nr:MAG: cupin domain-containing protein [Methanomassiliicoccales archaeon]